MKFLPLLAFIAPAVAEFSCVKPVNPIPAGTSGVCCEELHQDILLTFLYTGQKCTRSKLLNKADDGSTTYASCDEGQQAACCDPLLEDLHLGFNLACVLPSS